MQKNPWFCASLCEWRGVCRLYAVSFTDLPSHDESVLHLRLYPCAYCVDDRMLCTELLISGSVTRGAYIAKFLLGRCFDAVTMQEGFRRHWCNRNFGHNSYFNGAPPPQPGHFPKLHPLQAYEQSTQRIQEPENLALIPIYQVQDHFRTFQPPKMRPTMVLTTLLAACIAAAPTSLDQSNPRSRLVS